MGPLSGRGLLVRSLDVSRLHPMAILIILRTCPGLLTGPHCSPSARFQAARHGHLELLSVRSAHAPCQHDASPRLVH